MKRQTLNHFLRLDCHKSIVYPDNLLDIEGLLFDILDKPNSLV